MPENVAEKTWNFAVVAYSPSSQPKYIGFTDTYEGAVKLQRNATIAGWQGATVYDARLQPVKASMAETPVNSGL